MSKFTPEDKIAAAKTYRGGNWGKHAIVPRVVMDHVGTVHKVLDYGCGKEQAHVNILRAKGLNVTGYDFSLNNFPNNKKFDHVYASNVLNVQTSESMLTETLKEIHSLVAWTETDSWARVTLNYPSSPRKMSLTNIEMQDRLRKYFSKVVLVNHSHGSVVWECYDKETK